MSATPIIVIGAGGHAKVVVDALRCSGAEIFGIVDRDPDKQGLSIFGVPVFGSDDAVWDRNPNDVRLVNGIGSVHLPLQRRDVYARFTARGYVFMTVIHPSAVVSQDAEVEGGAQIMAGAIIQPGARIGADAIINTGAKIDHDCDIGAHVHIAPGATLSGDVVIGQATHVGCGATIIQGVKIGSECLIHAGAVVVADVPRGAEATMKSRRVMP